MHRGCVVVLVVVVCICRQFEVVSSDANMYKSVFYQRIKPKPPKIIVFFTFILFIRIFLEKYLIILLSSI